MVSALVFDSTMTRGLGTGTRFRLDDGATVAPDRNSVVTRGSGACQTGDDRGIGQRPRLTCPDASMDLSSTRKQLIATFGTIGLILIIFAESGLLLGFFLPGDSLLFTAGLLRRQRQVRPQHRRRRRRRVRRRGHRRPGRATGSARRYGPSMFRRPDSRIFKQEYVERSPTSSSRSTARRRSCSPASCRSCGRSRRSWRASATMDVPDVLVYNVVGAVPLGRRGDDARLLPRSTDRRRTTSTSTCCRSSP